jgi:hypothetical protein
LESQEKRQLGRPKFKWEDNIKVDFVEVDGVEWIVFICLRIGISGRLL